MIEKPKICLPISDRAVLIDFRDALGACLIYASSESRSNSLNQRDRGLVPDGIVGPKTGAVLD